MNDKCEYCGGTHGNRQIDADLYRECMIKHMGKIPTDNLGNCLACGRLIVPSEDDVTKARLVLHNAGYVVLYTPEGAIFIEPKGDIVSRLRKAADLMGGLK